ncbi:hypothetical protein [Streptomyces tsukubensis]|uniref:hypothetical protein n=1 Tax=Streptomyces tsukubensis TaxID=83656 RepID=UPI001D04BBB7|nr:hypothetical protein [Streptomyces tsukubensis]
MKFPVSEEALELARRMAANKYPYPDDESAMADLLERWNLGLGMTRAERRIALRMAREQSTIELPPTDAADAAATLPSVARVLAPDSVVVAEVEEDLEPEPYEGQLPGDDDDDDELDGPVRSIEGPDDDDDDDFYADALEDA